ncbi:MAG: homocysteine S-methyltransferase family protein [Rhodoplanes sp.]
MNKYRGRLPQLDGGLFLTDGGIETTLVFHEGLDLPYFAAFDLLRTPAGRQTLRRYFERYIAIAHAQDAGFVLESPTWRASADWGEKLGYSREALAAANRDAIALMGELRDAHEKPAMPMVISGCVGPRGDGYDPDSSMSATEAQAYHAEQIRTFSETEADMVTAITMTNAEEAIGLARAAQECGMPVAISFTVETDGRLPTGQSLEDAIEAVDAATQSAPAYYMINCAHPIHFATTLAAGAAWCERLRGLRANASKRSHAELNEAPDLDDGDPEELGRQYRDLLTRHRQLNVLGGCCGTDHRHVEQIALSCKTAA